jgi:hypothetical protein
LIQWIIRCLRLHLEDLDDATYDALMAAEIGRLRAQINDEAVCELAYSLNNDTPCIIEYPSKAVGPGSLTRCANYTPASALLMDPVHGSCECLGFRALPSDFRFLSQNT